MTKAFIANLKNFIPLKICVDKRVGFISYLLVKVNVIYIVIFVVLD